MGLLASCIEVLEGDDPIAILIIELHLPAGAVELVGPGLIKVPLDELVKGYESVLRGQVDLWEERADAVVEIKAVVVVDDIFLLFEELLPLLHVLVRPAVSVFVVEEAVVLALPFLVLQPVLHLGDGRVKGVVVMLLLMLRLSPVRPRS